MFTSISCADGPARRVISFASFYTQVNTECDKLAKLAGGTATVASVMNF